MNENQLYAVTESGVQPLVIPPEISSLTDLYADVALGVYSALRTYDHNKFLELDAHLDRTERSMALLGWDYQLNRRRLCAALHQITTAYPGVEARVRFDVLAEPATSLGSDSRELIALTSFTPEPKHYYTQGVGVDLVPDLMRAEPLAKTADFAELRNRMLPARSQAHYEYLLLDDEDNLLEGTLTNFWGVRDGQVYTAGDGVLEGITRKILLDLIPAMAIPLQQVAVNKRDLGYLDEAFLSGSSRAVMPVIRIASFEIGNGHPGLITRQVLRAYQAYVAEHVKTAVE